ncbi:hypothetical protein [Cytobacillus firmus]|uniref:Phage head morphogenesis domain-containing protein n=1 Tax=Cytobacillus firmus DS1 TaxID=1307436 RepID=W7KZG1_CYTFI|nr:hypothetical protein [Cytobacillus firmus]EWG12710.1 hypothetical protein PBF_04205 [Cytobacillus firmus DS1]
MNFQDRVNKFSDELVKVQSSPMKMSYKIRKMNDEKVCSLCANHEKNSGDVLEAVIGVNHPPFHEGCRCIATYSIEGIR